MKHFLLLSGILFILFGCSTFPQNSSILKKERTIDLPNVEGRIDHMSIDLKSERLFIAALANGSIEVVNLNSGKIIHSITGLEEPQGVLYYPKKNLLFVASGGDGTCRIYNASGFKLLNIIQLGDDADNIRYDKQRDIIYIGFGSGGIAAIDPSELKLLYRVDLPGHPESFRIDDSRGLMFVNIPNAGQMEAINLEERKVIQKIDLDVRGNFPMALDTLNHIIFIGSRNPSRIVSFDEISLKKISENNISGDADDIFYDTADSLIFISCGSGELDIYKQITSKKIILKESIRTSPGARTSLYVPELKKLFIAARRSDRNNAKVIEYSIQH